MTSYFDASIGDEQQFRVALNNGGMNPALMKIVGNNGSLGKVMVDALKAHLAEEERIAATFEREEVASEYRYPDGWQVKPLMEQAMVLELYFPGLDVSHIEELASRFPSPLSLAEGMDGLVVIPKPSVVVRYAVMRSGLAGIVLPDLPVENLAFWDLLGVMHRARPKICEYQSRGFHDSRYRLTKRTRAAYEMLDRLPGDVMVLMTQTGCRHRGKSPRRSRFVFGANEFGLCAFATGTILLTHPERLAHYNHLGIDSSGAELFDPATQDYTRVLSWRYPGEVNLLITKSDEFNPRFGTASAYHPDFTP